MKHWPIFVLCVVALLVTYISHAPVVVTADGVGYLSTAENLAAGKGYVNYAGLHPYTFMPGYSYALATATTMMHGSSRDQVIRAVNLLALLAVGIFSWLILIRYTSRLWGLLGAIAAMASPLMASSAHSALSECLFMGLTMAWMYAVVRMEE